MLDILLLVVILVVLILVHEAGHFAAAKWSGARVDEFGFGFPPKLFGKKFGETEYTVNAILFGGFVRIFGEDPDEEALEGPDKERAFVAQPKWKQALMIAAGVALNFALAWVLLSAALTAGLPAPVASAPAGATIANEQTVITTVLPDSPAAAANLAAGDTIRELAVGEETLEETTIPAVQEFISSHVGEAVVVTVARGGEERAFSVTPELEAASGAPGIGVGLERFGTVTLPWYRAVIEGARMTADVTVAVVYAFGSIIANAFQGEPSLSQLTGPVGIVGLVGDAAEFGFVYLLSFVALISINLGVLNLIPFPALDGGRLLFLGIEAIKGTPVSPRIANTAHLIGFALLILLMLIVTYQDIMRLL